MIEQGSMFYLEVTIPVDQLISPKVPHLLRRAADAIDDLGEIYVYDMLLDEASTDSGEMSSLVLFYSRHKLPIRPQVAQLHDDEVCKSNDDKPSGAHTFDADENLRHQLAHDTERSVSLNNSFRETEISSIPKLLRQVAGLIELLGDIHVEDIVLSFQEYVAARVPTITTYYHRPDRSTEHRHSPEIHGGAISGRDPAEVDLGKSLHYVTIKDRKNEPGYLSRPRLLRKTADAVEELGDIDVQGLFLHEELTDGKWVPEHVSFVTVYYVRAETHGARNARHDDGEAHSGLQSPGRAGRRKALHRNDTILIENRANRWFRLQSAPSEPGCHDIPELLRRAADAVDSRHKTEIDDLVLHFTVRSARRVPTMAVYYSSPTPNDEKFRTEWRRLEEKEKRRSKRRRTKE